MSAGGYLALLVATAPLGSKQQKDNSGKLEGRVNAVVVYFPTGFDWAAEPELLEAHPALKIDPGTLDTLSLKRRISGDEPPALIIYGEEDSGFITRPSEALYAAMQDNLHRGNKRLWRGR